MNKIYQREVEASCRRRNRQGISRASIIRLGDSSVAWFHRLARCYRVRGMVSEANIFAEAADSFKKDLDSFAKLEARSRNR